jgi:hypothetical protein
LIIRKSKRFLTKHNLKIDSERESVLWPSIIKSIKNNSEENIRELLFDIFPYFKAISNKETNSYDEEYLIAIKSVGCFNYFDYYFKYDLNENVIPEDSFEILKKYFCDNKKFVSNVKTMFLIDDGSKLFPVVEGILVKLFRRADDLDILKRKLDSGEEKEFLQNLIWLYIYSNRNSVSQRYITIILSKLYRNTGVESLCCSLKSILNENDYSNYFYAIEFLNMVKNILLGVSFEQNRNEVEKYKNFINEIIVEYIDLVLMDEKILDYLSKDTFETKIQVERIIKFIKNSTNTTYIVNNLLVSYVNSDKFERLKKNIFEKYFDLIYLFVKYSIKKKIVEGSLCLFLEKDSLYPFSIEEVVESFGKKKISKDDRIFNVLLRAFKKGID